MHTKVYRNDGYAKVTGRASFVDDFRFNTIAFAVPVYSQYVHAKILKIHTKKAKNAPGVLGVFTWKDVHGKLHCGQINHDLPIFAKDKIRYEGDVIAIVVAETKEQALSAASLVNLDAEELPPLLSVEEAMKDGAPLVHEQIKGNIVCHHKIRRGNCEEAFKNCDFVIEKEFTTPFVEHMYLEPEGSICRPRFDGILEVYGSMQHPFSTRRFISIYLGLSESQIEVYSHPTGGSFGGKDDTAAVVCARTTLAADRLQRLVKTIYTREWSMKESYKRVPFKIRFKYGLSQSGKILAIKCHVLADSGAYTSTTPWLTWRAAVQSCGPYEIENVHTDVISVATNNVYTGAFRGFGAPQMNFAIEQMMDICAYELKISPINIRKINMLKQDSTTITGQVLNNHTVSTDKVLETILTASDYDLKIKNNSYGKTDNDRLYGIGLAMSYRGTSIGAEGIDFASCIINCQFDGSIILSTGIHENGQGAESAMTLILAEQLGVNIDRIHYHPMSTSHIPDSGTTVASRGTMMGGGAIYKGVIKLKKFISEALCEELGCDPEKIQFKDDYIWGKNELKLHWPDAIKILHQKRIYPYSFGYYQAPAIDWDEEKGQGIPYFSYVYSCQAVELEVNKKTGKVKLLNIWAAHDIGKAVNPGLVKGQIYGGITQGIGMTLTEELQMENGHITSLNYNQYKVPKATDIPEIRAFIIENPDPNSPTGAKGIGEPALEIIAPAIANAVYAATGKRYYSLPIKIEGESSK
ncbi:MAG: xanthine dehydrogenase family protein molybdopterin-binding subunit [Spirochaetes bacterium]|nr:xanthine dehydrogenase family protein molybdopterin-binding subunit [Spirochaetota bacterium]